MFKNDWSKFLYTSVMCQVPWSESEAWFPHHANTFVKGKSSLKLRSAKGIAKMSAVSWSMNLMMKWMDSGGKLFLTSG